MKRDRSKATPRFSNGAFLIIPIIWEAIRKGAEKSVFKFGRSAVLFVQKGAWAPSPDILARAREGIATFIRLGDVIRRKQA